LNTGTAAAARNVLLSITGRLQLLYRRNTCRPSLGAADDSAVLQIVNHGQLMGGGHDAAGGLAVEIGAGGSVPIGSSIRVHRERCKGSRRASLPARPMAGGQTRFSTALRCPVRSTSDDRDHADVPESAVGVCSVVEGKCCGRRVHRVGERVGEGSLTEDVNMSPLVPKSVQHNVTGCECLRRKGPVRCWEDAGPSVRRQRGAGRFSQPGAPSAR
jgi:hypothetical protein